MCSKEDTVWQHIKRIHAFAVHSTLLTILLESEHFEESCVVLGRPLHMKTV